ncbi:conserved hypothetical protein [Xenorhabdus bovienii str. puntauvense]|uniref:Uncharacterized protein n=1 Tax=Xenorhabdus bovienii str. puntauvense TaxID=1398201 RepID=A0A077NMF4_XENBV|nr:hypothetical protein [Xenorhabdus bovienii]CDG98915.1 conserved hypothetical protein [Xenorhabdus bovienii str. puntauvense]
MNLSNTIIPKSDQLNFEDVQTENITAIIKSVRAGTNDQPVFIDLVGYDGRPYKPSKSMRRVLIGGWSPDGHSWVGKSLTLIGDPTVRYGGVAVGGIKISAMSDIDGDFSMMLSVSRGKRVEHRVKKLISPQEILNWFTDQASEMDLTNLEKAYKRAETALGHYPEYKEKVAEVYSIRKSELEAA